MGVMVLVLPNPAGGAIASLACLPALIIGSQYMTAKNYKM